MKARHLPYCHGCRTLAAQKAAATPRKAARRRQNRRMTSAAGRAQELDPAGRQVWRPEASLALLRWFPVALRQWKSQTYRWEFFIFCWFCLIVRLFSSTYGENRFTLYFLTLRIISLFNIETDNYHLIINFQRRNNKSMEIQEQQSARKY